MKIRQLGAKFHAGRQMDGHDKADGLFRNCVNALKIHKLLITTNKFKSSYRV